MHQNPFTLKGPGIFAVSLSAEERRFLRELPSELMKQLESGEDDASMYRLFPPGYTADLPRQVEYDGLMRDRLQASHTVALRLLQDTADTLQLTADELEAWTRALNQLRLVLGTRLDIIDEDDGRNDPTDPRAGQIALFDYLGGLQSLAIEALGDPEVHL